MTRRIVLDATITVSWALPDEHGARAEEAWRGLGCDRAFVPHCWWFEVRNGLLSGERRGRTTAEANRRFLRGLGALPIQEEPHPDQDELFALARRHRLSVHDAAYLELARRAGCALATLDGLLAAAAEAEGIVLAG